MFHPEGIYFPKLIRQTIHYPTRSLAKSIKHIPPKCELEAQNLLPVAAVIHSFIHSFIAAVKINKCQTLSFISMELLEHSEEPYFNSETLKVSVSVPLNFATNVLSMGFI